MGYIFVIARFGISGFVIARKSVGFSWQSTTESSLRGDSCVDLLLRFPVIARKSVGFSWQSILAIRESPTIRKSFESLVFSRKKGCTPLPAPPTRPKAAAFSLLGGEPRLSVSSKKSAGGTTRSEERRVGKECSEPCRSRWSPYH